MLQSQNQPTLPINTPISDLIRNLNTELRNHTFCANKTGTELREAMPELFSNQRSVSNEFTEFLRDIFPKLVSFFIEQPTSVFADLSYTPSDIFYFISDPIGNILRRPFIAAHLAANARTQVECPDSAVPLRELLLTTLVQMGFSRFIGDEKIRETISAVHDIDSVYFDARAVTDAIAAAIADDYTSTMHYLEELDNWCKLFSRDQASLAGDHFIQELNAPCSPSEDGKQGPFPFYSDPWHAFNAWEMIASFRMDADYTISRALRKIVFSRPISVMFVEDNYFQAHIMSKMYECPNVSPFKGKILPVDVSDQVDWERKSAQGIYQKAEHALLQLHSGFESGILPDVIFVDIELGEGMNGLEFCKIVADKCQSSNKKIEIRFVTSSNMTIYEKAVQDLIARGIVTHAKAKSDFHIPTVLQELANIFGQEQK